jgi:hypothetical protein
MNRPISAGSTDSRSRDAICEAIVWRDWLVADPSPFEDDEDDGLLFASDPQRAASQPTPAPTPT